MTTTVKAKNYAQKPYAHNQRDLQQELYQITTYYRSLPDYEHNAHYIRAQETLDAFEQLQQKRVVPVRMVELAKSLGISRQNLIQFVNWSLARAVPPTTSELAIMAKYVRKHEDELFTPVTDSYIKVAPLQDVISNMLSECGIVNVQARLSWERYIRDMYVKYNVTKRRLVTSGSVRHSVIRKDDYKKFMNKLKKY